MCPRMTFYMFHVAGFEQVSQAEVKLFFESVCGEVCDLIEVMSAFFLHKFNIHSAIYQDCIYRAIYCNAGISPEAARRLSPFYSNCLCRVCNGIYSSFSFLCAVSFFAFI